MPQLARQPEHWLMQERLGAWGSLLVAKVSPAPKLKLLCPFFPFLTATSHALPGQARSWLGGSMVPGCLGRVGSCPAPQRGSPRGWGSGCAPCLHVPLGQRPAPWQLCQGQAGTLRLAEELQSHCSVRGSILHRAQSTSWHHCALVQALASSAAG